MVAWHLYVYRQTIEVPNNQRDTCESNFVDSDRPLFVQFLQPVGHLVYEYPKNKGLTLHCWNFKNGTPSEHAALVIKAAIEVVVVEDETQVDV